MELPLAGQPGRAAGVCDRGICVGVGWYKGILSKDCRVLETGSLEHFVHDLMGNNII